MRGRLRTGDHTLRPTNRFGAGRPSGIHVADLFGMNTELASKAQALLAGNIAGQLLGVLNIHANPINGRGDTGTPRGQNHINSDGG